MQRSGSGWRLAMLFGPDPHAFLRHGAFHQQHHEHERECDNGQHTEHVEVGESRCLLATQIRGCLQGQLLRGNRVARLLQERPGSVIKEGTRSCIERIKIFAEPQAMELLTTLLQRLSQRGPYAAPFVAQEAQ